MEDPISFSSLAITPFLAFGIHELVHLLSGLKLGLNENPASMFTRTNDGSRNKWDNSKT